MAAVNPLAVALFAAGTVLVWGAVYGQIRHRRWLEMLYLPGDLLLLAANVIVGQWARVAVFAVVAVFYLWWWWRRRRDRRGTLAAWGAKAKARLAVMLRTLREKTKLRPVLRPGRLPA